eukprot:TRINITY_DN2386_c2_g1_i1.p1 TRINITY_DN2386_c2_g1~~TRINITY_DN2386_c2_g1_i1.p1  ORF type:complete len:542 (+),score=170.39 TRINITY_DN2386_c2_g1_i1:83-1627(+)
MRAAAAAVLPLLALGAPLNRIKLRQRPTGERVLIDDQGRERAFHGTNAVVKGPPWLPSRDGFDPDTSLTAQDFKYMQQAGLNVIRLGVMWPGAEPERGQYNATYLRMIKEIAAEAATYGIYTLADMHQDVLSERFCGEGIPAWASEPETLVPFPLPLKAPYAVDKETGFPTRQDCAKMSWVDYHAALATGTAYERLYTNHNNLTNSWGAFWAEVAKSFNGASELLGLELINEPFIGNPYKDPLHLLPDLGDRQRLQPAYDSLAAAIRAVDPDALIFFAGCTWDRTGDKIVDILPFGFTHAPGGAEFADRSVNAWHYYEPPQDKTKTKEYVAQRLSDARKIQVGTFLTESGINYLAARAAAVAESLGVSWASWEWKTFCKETAETKAWPHQRAAYGACKTGYGGVFDSEGKLEVGKLRSLARTYAQAIAGTFQWAYFNDSTREYQLRYTVDTAIAAPTVVSTSNLVYDNGFSFTVTPPGALLGNRAAPGLELRPAEATPSGTTVSVTILPNSALV